MRLFTLGLIAVWSVVLVICIPNFVHGTGPDKMTAANYTIAYVHANTGIRNAQSRNKDQWIWNLRLISVVGGYGHGNYHYPVKKIGVFHSHIHHIHPYGPDIFHIIIFLVIFLLIIKLLPKPVAPVKKSYDKGDYKLKKKDSYYEHDYGYNKY